MKKYNTELFINKALKIHSNKYSYEKTIYINTRIKVIITCPIHGDFYQLPSGHLFGYGCPTCSGRYPMSTEEFKNKLKIIFPNLTVIDEYKNLYSKIKVMDELGIIYNSLPNDLLRKHPPSIETAVDKNFAYLLKAKKIHGNKYDYSQVYYKNTYTLISIICPIHGVFKQIPYNHLHGAGCRKCDGGGWSRTQWLNLCNKYKNKDPKVYIIRCYNDIEEFIKIGITSKSVYSRFPNKSYLPYSYEILKEIKGSPDFVWDKEHELHRLYGRFKYKPLISFQGETECFDISILDALSL